MSAKILSSLTDESQDLQKQIGCMNGIFQLFDRHNSVTGWRVSSHNNKRLLLGAQHQHQLDPQRATKAVVEKDLDLQEEKLRVSMDSSRASYSSSSCSSTFSSLDCNRTAQPEPLSMRQITVHESPFQITATKEPQASLTKGLKSLDLRDVVKDSMYREVHGLTNKFQPADKRRGHVMKHIDSPRPMQQTESGKPRTKDYEGSTQILAKVQEGTKNYNAEWPTLPRFSYDGRESRQTFKSTMQLKELPRLSLDSKASSTKCSSLDSRSNFIGRDQQMTNENSSQVLLLNQEPGSHNRSSSVVAKLMGLDAFPDNVSPEKSRIAKIKLCPKEGFLSQSSTTAEKSMQNQVSYSPRATQNNPQSPSPQLHNANAVRKSTCSRFPVEPAPWRQQDSSQGSQKMAAESKKASTVTRRISSSVYGEIEKRITKLEFERSGKDLRALKQILEAMHKTRDRLANQKVESAESTSQRRCSLVGSFPVKNSSLPALQNRKNHHKVPSITSGPHTQLVSSIVIMKPAKVMDGVKISSSSQIPTMEMHLQRVQTRDPKYHRENSARRQKAKDLTPRNNSLKYTGRHLPSIDNDTNWRTSELERTTKAPQRMNVESCNTSGRSFGVLSPRLPQNLLTIEGQSHPTTPSLDSVSVKRHSGKKVVGNGSQNKKQKVKSKDLELSDDQLREFSSEARYSSYQGDTASENSESNNSLASHAETEVISIVHSINTIARQQKNSLSTLREHMPAVELAVTMQEQPSPISVLDATFYSDDSPSPIKKISTAFQDERPSPDVAEWHFENLNHIIDSTRSDRGYNYNQKLENMKHMVRELGLLNSEPDKTAVNQNETVDGSFNPDHRYINNILLTSGLLKDTGFIPTVDNLLSTCDLIDPDMFHILEQIEETVERGNGELVEKNNQNNLNQKIERKIVFDMVNEILVRKITPDRLFTVGRKKISPKVLVKEVYLEVDRLCRMPDGNRDDKDDGLVRLLTADMMYQSEDWAEYSGEAPALVLDIERQIFKDMVNEVVTGEIMSLCDWPKRRCRQLFTK